MICVRLEKEDKVDGFKKMKGGKALGLNGIAVVLLTHGDHIVIEMLLRVFDKYMEEGIVPEDWKLAFIIL